MNHVHIADTHHAGCKDISPDKLLLLGTVLREIYEPKLRWQFPDKPCVVDFEIPDEVDDIYGYQIFFWQKRHEAVTP